MKKLFMLLIFVIISLLACGKSGPSMDSKGNTPMDLAKQYYAAINSNNLEKIKSLYSSGYYDSIVTKLGFLKAPDHSLFNKHAEQRFKKSKNFTFQENRSGFHSNNAEGVYSTAYHVEFTDDAAKKTGFANINDELCFKLVDNLWKITDKLKGY